MHISTEKYKGMSVAQCACSAISFLTGFDWNHSTHVSHMSGHQFKQFTGFATFSYKTNHYNIALGHFMPVVFKIDFKMRLMYIVVFLAHPIPQSITDL